MEASPKYRFIKASQLGDVNCLVEGKYSELTTGDGTTMQQLFDQGWTIASMTELNTGFILIAFAAPQP